MHNNNIILVLSFILGALVSMVSLTGIYEPGFYAAETPNWQVQTLGQDIIDLFIAVPCLLISAVFAYKNNKIAIIAWGGSVSYLAYTFTLYCFNIHFNRLFIMYCMCLGLSFYSTIYFIAAAYKKQIFFRPGKNSGRVYTGIYFIFIALIFYTVWLSEIIPANLKNITMAGLKETGLPTNGVHVLDLAILLPAIIFTSVCLLKRKNIGFILTPMLLIFFILMNTTIGLLQYLMRINGLADGPGVMYIMLSLAAVSCILLILFFKDSKPVLLQ